MYWQQWHCSGQNILDRKGTLSWQWDNVKIPETVEMTYFGYAAASFLENLEICASLSFTSEPMRRNFLSLVGVKEDGFLGSNFSPCLIKSSSLHYMWLQKSRSVLTFLHLHRQKILLLFKLPNNVHSHVSLQTASHMLVPILPATRFSATSSSHSSGGVVISSGMCDCQKILPDSNFLERE